MSSAHNPHINILGAIQVYSK